MPKALTMTPDVLYLILCNDIQTDSKNYHRCNVLGLITSIRSAAAPPFPVEHPRMIALVVWTGGEGTGELALRIIEDRSGDTVYRTHPRQVQFVATPQLSVVWCFASTIVPSRSRG